MKPFNEGDARPIAQRERDDARTREPRRGEALTDGLLLSVAKKKKIDHRLMCASDKMPTIPKMLQTDVMQIKVIGAATCCHPLRSKSSVDHSLINMQWYLPGFVGTQIWEVDLFNGISTKLFSPSPPPS